MTLTDAQIRRLAPVEKDRFVPAGGRLGLYLVHRASGRKTWQLRRRVAGKWAVQTLEPDWPALTALNARRMAMTAIAPAAVAPVTFGKAVEQFYAEQIEPRYRHAPRETLAYLTRDCNALATRRLDRVTRADLVGIVRAKTAVAPNAAAKLLAITKQFFAWAQLGGLIEQNPTIGLTGKTLKIPPLRPRERVLDDEEIRALWALDDEPYGRLLRFSLLTGARIGEVIGFGDDQVRRDLWTIPQTKNGKAHTLPLASTAASLAAQGWPGRGYQALFSYLTSRGIAWRPHDLRRTAATRMRQLGVDSETVEAVLNHSRPGLIRSYQRHDMLPAMREALGKLDAHISSLVTPPPLRLVKGAA